MWSETIILFLKSRIRTTGRLKSTSIARPFGVEVVHQVEGTKATTAPQTIAHEICRPPLIHRFRSHRSTYTIRAVSEAWNDYRKASEIVRQRNPDLKRTVEKLSAREMRDAIDNLERDGRIVEIADAKERLRSIASAYCEGPENTLVVSPRNRERVQLNSYIHRQLQQDDRIGQTDHQTTVYVNHQNMTGTERTFANAYRPGEDIIRYNRVSKVYGVKVGDYALVTAKNHAENEITIRFETATTHLQPAAALRRERLLRGPTRICNSARP